MPVWFMLFHVIFVLLVTKIQLLFGSVNSTDVPYPPTAYICTFVNLEYDKAMAYNFWFVSVHF